MRKIRRRTRRTRPLRNRRATPQQATHTLHQLDDFQQRCIATIANQLRQDLNELPTIAYIPTHALENNPH